MSDGWSLNVESGDEHATQQLLGSVRRARNLGVVLMILVAGLLGAFSMLGDSALRWGSVVCLLHTVAHVLMCEGLRRYVLRIAKKRQVVVQINAAPREHVRRGWLRRAGHHGGGAFWLFISALMLLLWDSYALGVIAMFAFTLRSGDSLVGPILVAAVGVAFIIISMIIMGASLNRTHARMALVDQDARVSEHFAAALEQQGGELSVSAETFGGELSIAQAQQGGELGGYEAENVASDAAAVEVSEASEVSR